MSRGVSLLGLLPKMRKSTATVAAVLRRPATNAATNQGMSRCIFFLCFNDLILNSDYVQHHAEPARLFCLVYASPLRYQVM